MADSRLDELRAGDTVVKLEPRKMQLLMALARRPGELVTTEELFETVWKDVVVTQSSVYQSIAQLRKTLGDDSDHPTYITTIPRKGYRLVAPVAPWPGDVPPKSSEPAAEPSPSASEPAHAPMAWSRRAWVAVAAAGGVGLAALGVRWWRGEHLVRDSPVRLAVLPFADLSEPANAAFANGMTDELQAALEHVPGLQVSARSSSLILAAQGQHASAIATRLGVSHFVRGEVRRAAGRVVISAELIAQDSGKPVWSGTYEQDEREVIQLPPQITRAIADALDLSVSGRRSEALATPDFKALELYFAGAHHLRMATPESVRTARDYFRRAAEQDPRFARAYAGLALAWMAGHDFEGLPLREVVRNAQPLVDQALSLAPDSAVVQAVQGYVFLSTLRLRDAEVHLQRALELNPNFASAEFWRGMTAAFDGRPLDAIPIYVHAGQLDPMNFLLHLLLGQAYSDVGQFQGARESIGRARLLAPRHPNGARGLGCVAYAEGNTTEAIVHYREAAQLNAKRYDIHRELAWLYLDAGLNDEATDAFERAISNAPTLPFLIAESSLVGVATGDSRLLTAAIRRIERYDPKPLPTGAQAELAWLYLLRGEVSTALRLADAVAGLIMSDPVTLTGPWETYLGQSVHIDLATIYEAAGDPAKSEPIRAVAWAELERLEHNRVAWHTVPYLKARIRALRGDGDAALAELERANARGFRRGWWLPSDPALKRVQGTVRLNQLVESMHVESAEARRRLKSKAVMPR